MANKTIYPFGTDGQLPSSIGVINDLTTGGADKALSAEQGKILAQYAFLGSGTFADAYDKAKTTIAYFPWLLEDTDKDGNAIKKMIWHVGNREFIDAIGAKIDGVKNGVTVTTDTAGYMRIWDTVQYQLQSSKWYDYELSVGENNFSFDEIGGNRHMYVEFVNSAKDGMMSNANMTVDFGGMTLTTYYSSGGTATSGTFQRYPNLFHSFSNLKSVKRLNIEPTSSSDNIQLLSWFYANSSLEYLQIGGTVTRGTISSWLQQSRSLVNLDLSQLSVPIASIRTGFNFSLSSKLEYIDIRGVNFSGGTSIASFLNFSQTNAVKTVVVGNIDTSSVTASSNFCNNIKNATLVCTQDTPPGWGVDIITGHFTSIKVPNKNVDVDGTATAVIDLYKAANGWSTYADIMSTYEEGEY